MPERSSINVLAAVFVIAGVILTLETTGVVTGIARFWPLLIIILGIGFLGLFNQKGRNDLVLAWLGTFSIGLGTLFGYLNHAGWLRISRLWPIFLALVGVSFTVLSFFSPNRAFAWSAVLFLSLFVVFYLVFSVSLSLWPLSLVIFGLCLFWISSALGKA